MNEQMNEINEIIDLCDEMIEYIKSKGIIRSGDSIYEAYKIKIDDFFRKYHLEDRDYAPYAVLSKLFFTHGYSVNLSEASMIRRTVVDMKHELCPNCYERIFISHREIDRDQVRAFINLLYFIGIPRPLANAKEKTIFCTSHPASYIANGDRNLDEIRNQMNSDRHALFIMWYTDNYFESQACLNEVGAIWASGKKYQEILSPSLDSGKIRGLLDKQPVWFRSNDKYRLNTFKDQIVQMFSLPSLDQNAWESARDDFINTISTIS